ncbi:MAG: hypothetical protein M3552_03150 [Planctomycetota bacterium]|nr:hypothetical protein [Planctomycetota bacterium]
MSWAKLNGLGLVAAAAIFTFAAQAKAADDVAERKVPANLEEARDVDVDQKRAAFSADAGKLVFMSTTKDREGSWDLGDKGVAHIRSGKSCWVVGLQPDGESQNYYWVKEKIGTGAWSWGFKKQANPDGMHDIIMDNDGDNVYERWATGLKLTRIKL